MKRNNDLYQKKVIAIALFLTGSLLQTPTALANETVCDGIISSGTFDNIFIPEGASCTLTGDVVVEGDVEADGAVDVIIGVTDIGNNVVDGIIIEGNVKIENTTGTIDIRDTQIDGNVTLRNNPAEGDINVVNGNTIGGNVVAKNNESITDDIFIGSCGSGGNTVDGNVTVVNNTAADFLIVNCSTIAGNVTVRDNATENGIQVAGDMMLFIEGNLTVANNTVADEFGVRPASVNGNVTVRNNTAAGDGLFISRSTVAGNLSVEDNLVTEGGGDEFDQGFIVVGSVTFPGGDPLPGNIIGGNVTVKNNTVIEGSIPIEDNTVDGNLTCKKNDPDPTTSGNVVGGNEKCND